eukprot:gene12380-8859_t
MDTSNGDENDPVQAFVRNALQAKEHGNSFQYDVIVTQLRRREDPETICRVIVVMENFASYLSHRSDLFHELLHAIFSYDWKGDDRLNMAMMDLIITITSCNVTFAKLAYRGFVHAFFQPDLATKEEEDKDAHKRRFDVVHDGIRAISSQVPMSTTILFDELRTNFPHKRFAHQVQSEYLQHCLRICDSIPRIRDKILDLVVLKCLEIDVEIVIDDAGDESADKLDAMLTRIVEYIAAQSPSAAAKATAKAPARSTSHYVEFWPILLKIFEKRLLVTPQSKFVQFLFFYASTALQPQIFAESFGRRLLVVAFDLSAPVAVRLAATMYLASFLARANVLPLPLVRDLVREMLEWCVMYVLVFRADPRYAAALRHASPAATLSSLVKRRLKKKFATLREHLDEFGRLQVKEASIRQHVVFYAMAQAVAYVFCFYGADLVDALRPAAPPSAPPSASASAKKPKKRKHRDSDATDATDDDDVEAAGAAADAEQRKHVDLLAALELVYGSRFDPLRYVMPSVRYEFFRLVIFRDLFPAAMWVRHLSPDCMAFDDDLPAAATGDEAAAAASTAAGAGAALDDDAHRQRQAAERNKIINNSVLQHYYLLLHQHEAALAAADASFDDGDRRHGDGDSGGGDAEDTRSVVSGLSATSRLSAASFFSTGSARSTGSRASVSTVAYGQSLHSRVAPAYREWSGGVPGVPAASGRSRYGSDLYSADGSAALRALGSEADASEASEVEDDGAAVFVGDDEDIDSDAEAATVTTAAADDDECGAMSVDASPAAAAASLISRSDPSHPLLSGGFFFAAAAAGGAGAAAAVAAYDDDDAANGDSDGDAAAAKKKAKKAKKAAKKARHGDAEDGDEGDDRAARRLRKKLRKEQRREEKRSRRDGDGDGDGDRDRDGDGDAEAAAPAALRLTSDSLQQQPQSQVFFNPVVDRFLREQQRLGAGGHKSLAAAAAAHGSSHYTPSRQSASTAATTPARGAHMAVDYDTDDLPQPDVSPLPLVARARHGGGGGGGGYVRQLSELSGASSQRSQATQHVFYGAGGGGYSITSTGSW